MGADLPPFSPGLNRVKMYYIKSDFQARLAVHGAARVRLLPGPQVRSEAPQAVLDWTSTVLAIR